MTRLRSEARTGGPERLCRGTLLSRQQYLVDVHEWGFRDARLEERVQMNEKDIADWTDAIEKRVITVAVFRRGAAALPATELQMPR